MPNTTTPSVTLSRAGAATNKADVVVVGITPEGRGIALAPGGEEIDEAFDGRLADTLSIVGAVGRAEEVTVIPSNGAVSASLVAAVGLGEDGATPENLRRAAGAVVRHLAGKAASVAFALPGADLTGVGALAEGALLGAYAFTAYRSTPPDSKPVGRITVLSERAREKEARNTLARAEAVAAAVNLTRDLVNTPPKDLPPAELANRAKSEARKVGVDVEVLDEKALAKAGYGGIIGVGQGSTRPPRLVRLSYRPAKADRHLALVGKGITFDTGGLSLKPPDSMMTMKTDMAGAAAVLGAVVAIARLGLPINVTGYLASAENMPSGSAIRPSDVLKIYGGKTVEVLNTDAEGRLVLADGIVRAGEDSPDTIIDVATLTGACVVALGTKTYGIMGNDEDLVADVRAAAERGGEDGWPLPIPEGTKERLDSKVADLCNISGDRYGGALVAGAFLREFVGEGIDWAHLDIAGPSFNEGAASGYTPKGATGSGVRTLVALAEHAAESPADAEE